MHYTMLLEKSESQHIENIPRALLRNRRAARKSLLYFFFSVLARGPRLSFFLSPDVTTDFLARSPELHPRHAGGFLRAELSPSWITFFCSVYKEGDWECNREEYIYNWRVISDVARGGFHQTDFHFAIRVYTRAERRTARVKYPKCTRL